MSGTIPTCTSGMENTVSSAATRMSQQSASSSPPPMHTRWMAAITGTRQDSSREKHSWRCFKCPRMPASAWGGVSFSGRFKVEPALRSSPAQNAPPAPVSTATRTSFARSTWPAASARASHISTSSAFSRSGLLSVIVATGALMSTCTLSMAVLSAVEGLDEGGQPRIVLARRIGLIERGAVEQPRVAPLHGRLQTIVGSRHGIRVEHLVGDELGHALPVTFDGLPMELGGEVAPAMTLEHGLIGPRRSVEGDLLLHHLRLLAALGRRVAHHH